MRIIMVSLPYTENSNEPLSGQLLFKGRFSGITAKLTTCHITSISQSCGLGGKTRPYIE